jgi:hypothetical protein
MAWYEMSSALVPRGCRVAIQVFPGRRDDGRRVKVEGQAFLIQNGQVDPATPFTALEGEFGSDHPTGDDPLSDLGQLAWDTKFVFSLNRRYRCSTSTRPAPDRPNKLITRMECYVLDPRTGEEVEAIQVNVYYTFTHTIHDGLRKFLSDSIKEENYSWLASPERYSGDLADSNPGHQVVTAEKVIELWHESISINNSEELKVGSEVR